jgi:hypothetical protein
MDNSADLTPLQQQEIEISERRRLAVIAAELDEARVADDRLPAAEEVDWPWVLRNTTLDVAEVDWSWVLRNTTLDVAERFHVEPATASLMKLEAYKRYQSRRS